MTSFVYDGVRYEFDAGTYSRDIKTEKTLYDAMIDWVHGFNTSHDADRHQVIVMDHCLVCEKLIVEYLESNENRVSHMKCEDCRMKEYSFDIVAQNTIVIKAKNLREAREKLEEKSYEEIFDFYDIETIREG